MGVILITGCSSGFGLRTALRCAAAGHTVVATMRDTSRFTVLQDAAGAAGVTVEVAPLDVTDDASVTDAVAGVLERHGRIDALVNNAGIEVRGPVELVSDAEVREQFETNVFGLLRVTRAVIPHLRAQGSGVIVNLSSINGVIARPFAGIYAASKHAVEAISEAMHFELGLFDIRVHVIEPGQFPTELGANTRTAAAFTPEHDRYWAVAESIEGRIKDLVPGDGPADPDDVAAAVAAAIEDPDTPLRVPVGGDAGLILAARTGNTFEDYELLMRSTLDYWEGYRRSTT